MGKRLENGDYDHVISYEEQKLWAAEEASYKEGFEAGKKEAIKEIEASGEWVRIPCKVRDIIYSPRKHDILTQTVERFTIEEEKVIVEVSFECDYDCETCPHLKTYSNDDAGDCGCDGEWGYGSYIIEDFGKIVFLDREEAEKKLRGEKE